MVSADDILQDVVSGTQDKRKKEDQPSAKSLTGDDILNDALNRPSKKKETEQDKRRRAWMMIQELQNRPRPIRDRSTAASPMAALKAGVPTNRDQAIKIFAQERGIPVDQYALFPGGEIAYKKDDGNYYSEVPGIGVAPATSAAYYTPDVAEAAPSIFTGAASTPLGGIFSVPLTGAVSGATNAARQQLGNELAGEPDRPINKGEVALSFGLDALGQTLPFAVKGFSERKLASDIARMDKPAADALKAKADNAKISLTPAELTNLSSLKSTQKVLGNMPGGSDVLQDFYTKRFDNQIQPAVDDFLNRISRQGDATEAGTRARNALTRQRDALINYRDAQTRPMYERSFESALSVDVRPVMDRIDGMLETAKGRELTALRKIKAMLYKDVPQVNSSGQILDDVTQRALDDRPRALQKVKWELDAMTADEQFQSMDKFLRSEIEGIKTDIVRRLGANNPDYLAANARFEQLSRPINVFDERKPGSSLLRVAQDNDHQMASRIFNNASPDSVRYVRDQMMAQDPEAWSSMVRTYLEDVWTKALKPAAGATEKKVDAGLSWSNILMGDNKSQNVLRAAMTTEQFTSLKNLMDVLNAAGRVKKLGSDTAFNQAVIKEMQQDSRSLVSKISGFDLTRPLALVGDFLDQGKLAKNAESMARIITDPDAMNKLKELKKMSVTTPKFWALFAQVIASTGTVGSNNLE